VREKWLSLLFPTSTANTVQYYLDASQAAVTLLTCIRNHGIYFSNEDSRRQEGAWGRRGTIPGKQKMKIHKQTSLKEKII
jgi:hypothetical protein